MPLGDAVLSYKIHKLDASTEYSHPKFVNLFRGNSTLSLDKISHREKLNFIVGYFALKISRQFTTHITTGRSSVQWRCNVFDIRYDENSRPIAADNHNLKSNLHNDTRVFRSKPISFMGRQRRMRAKP